jgi:hypothetical protein
MDATDTLSRSLGLLDADENFAPPMVRYYGQLVDDAQADGGQDGFVTNSDEATDLVRALVRPLDLDRVIKVIPGEFLGDYFVLVPIPFVLPDFLEDGETWMEFEAA